MYKAHILSLMGSSGKSGKHGENRSGDLSWGLPRAERRPILLVDDDAAIREVLTLALKLHGYEVDAVQNYVEAREKLASGRYISILLDVVLPDISGIFFYHRLKALRPDLARRVIFLTGAKDLCSQLGDLRREGRPVLFKPARIPEVLEALQAFD